MDMTRSRVIPPGFILQHSINEEFLQVFPWWNSNYWQCDINCKLNGRPILTFSLPFQQRIALTLILTMLAHILLTPFWRRNVYTSNNRLLSYSQYPIIRPNRDLFTVPYTNTFRQSYFFGNISKCSRRKSGRITFLFSVSPSVLPVELMVTAWWSVWFLELLPCMHGSFISRLPRNVIAPVPGMRI